MRFEASPPNRPTRIVAGLALLGIGIGVTTIPGILSTFGGLGLFVTGLGVVCVNVYQATSDWLRRRGEDPYDLSRLWEEPLHSDDVPDAMEEDADDVVYCRRCGASMSAAYAVCPDCGHRLGY